MAENNVPQILVHSPKSEVRKVSAKPETAQMELMKPPTSAPPAKPLKVKTTGKEYLKQGHSMTDWMRKINSEPIRSASNRLISNEELKQHNTRDDGWMAIRGKVFDVTDYCDYHPGGVSYILKNLGTDATIAFDAIHAYVNFENILRGRQVGLYMGKGDAAKQSGKNGFCCKFCSGTDKQCEKLPLTSMDQNDTTVMYKVEIGCPSNKNVNDWSVGVMNKQQLSVRLVTRSPEIWLAKLKLSEKLADDKLKVTFENNFKKLVVTLQKPTNTKWKSIGTPLKLHNEFMDSRLAPIEYYPAVIVLKETLGASDVLFGIQLGCETAIGIPVGWHVKIRVDGHEKPYTPVTLISSQQDSKFLSPLKKDGDKNGGQIIFFVIKVYNNGLLTPLLNKVALNKPGVVDISGVRGNFDTDWLLDVDRLILVGGGTGLCPYVKMIKWIKDKKCIKDSSNCSSSANVKQVVLIFAASTLTGLIWDDAWLELAKSDDWFFYIPYVTRPPDDGSWTKNKGRITVSAVQESLDSIPLPQGKSTNSLKMKAMGCGPSGFTTTCQAIFNKLGLKSEEILMFEG